MYVPLNSIAQGIKFEEGINWEQIQSKAKMENKIIFVDCYATWCAPCKEMDKTVFADKSVVKYMSQNYISLRVQMDSTAKDDANTKLLYPLAKSFTKNYQISALPTFLFFSPDGNLLHKGIGFKGIKDFNTLISDAANPEKQYGSVISNWQSGKTPLKDLPALAQMIRDEYNDKKLSDQVVRDYMTRYLNQLDESDFFIKENLRFLGKNASMITSEDKAFKLFYYNSLKVDSILINGYPEIKNGYAKMVLKAVITKEEIDPVVSNADLSKKTPDWNDVEKKIRRKFDKNIAYVAVLDVKVKWYEKNRKWDDYIIYLVKQLDTYGKKDDVKADMLNNIAWKVFKYSNDKTLMNKAVSWSEIAISKTKGDDYLSITCIDTKACLLYALGNKEEAIIVEEEALSKFPKWAPFIKQRLEKIKMGEDVNMMKID